MTRTTLLYSSALIIALLGCSDSHRTSTDGGSDGGGRDAANDLDARVACIVECGPPPPGCHFEGEVSCDPPMCPEVVCDDVYCAPGGPARFPNFDRSCATEVDCMVALHQTDCCGTMRAMGIAASERARFEASEAQCSAMYPACGCASGLTTADDGTTRMGGSTEPVLRCSAGECTSSFEP